MAGPFAAFCGCGWWVVLLGGTVKWVTCRADRVDRDEGNWDRCWAELVEGDSYVGWGCQGSEVCSRSYRKDEAGRP